MQNDLNIDINEIIKFLFNKRGFDFSGNNPAMISRRINHRVVCTRSETISRYKELLFTDETEADNLLDVLTINVSRFYRDSLCFEYISTVLLPELILKKEKAQDNNIRIWSAGCATGEEPYTMAILINECLDKKNAPFEVKIFATDIDKKVLTKAIKGVYKYDSVRDLKLGLVKKYFSIEKDDYIICSDIKKMVTFSFFDLLDKKSHVPPASIYGNFDIILCRNVLIYFNMEHQKIIFSKLLTGACQNGHIILGEAEMPGDDIKNLLIKENNHCKIYLKK
jgi:chemotaxis methyl-accepting protein methylase